MRHIGWYDDCVSAAKRSYMGCIARGVKDIHELVAYVDEYVKALEERTDAIVRQRNERDRQIARLMSELAEAQHKPT